MAVLYTPHYSQFFDANGLPLNRGKLYTYAAGTTTPKETYTTAAGDVAHSNPIILDSSGRATLFLSGSYDFRLEDGLGNLIKETPNITAFSVQSSTVDNITANFTEDVIQTGDSIIFADLSDGNLTKRDTVQGLIDLVGTIPTVTEWVAYTPTLTGVGTATGVEFYSRRIGDTLEVRGKFTCGTTTATEARIELGFNGTSGSVTSAGSTKLPSTTSLCGTGAISVASAVLIHTLIERSVTYLTFGIQTVSNAGLSKANGTVFSSGQTVSIFASVPIAGW